MSVRLAFGQFLARVLGGNRTSVPPSSQAPTLLFLPLKLASYFNKPFVKLKLTSASYQFIENQCLLSACGRWLIFVILPFKIEY